MKIWIRTNDHPFGKSATVEIDYSTFFHSREIRECIRTELERCFTYIFMQRAIAVFNDERVQKENENNCVKLNG